MGEGKRCHNTSFTESGFVAGTVHRIYICGILKREEKFIETLGEKKLLEMDRWEDLGIDV